jgi:hypothetical protein
VSVLGGVLTERIQKSLSLPVDFLLIQPGVEGFTGTRIQTGRQVTERFFLGLQTQVGADVPLGQNRNQLEMEYQLNRRLLLKLEYGDARVGLFDLLWRKRY